MPIDVSGFNVGAIPVQDEGAFARLSQNRWRNMEWQYRMQKEKEADDWRKLNMIQDLTDLSKHQTSSDVANAIGNQHASNILQKYTASATNMSPAELQGKISQDMSGVLNGMEGTKNELDQTDKQLAIVKQQIPNLDFSSMAKDARADILNRRLKNDSEFINPVEVQPSQIDLGNPEFLSRYAIGNKNLRNYFQNPQGMDEMSVYKGNGDRYTKFTAKVPSYKKPSFDPTTLKNGFLSGGNDPSLQFKSSVLPSDAMPSSNGKPFEMMDREQLDNLDLPTKVELLAETRKQFPTYDSKFGPTEKEYAQRHVLLNTAKAFDQTNFHPTEVHTPSAALLKFEAGDTGKGSAADVNIRNIYKEITDKGAGHNHGAVPLVDLSTGAQSIALKQARDLTGDHELSQSDIYVVTYPDGRAVIKKAPSEGKVHKNPDDDTTIGEIDFTSANLPAQTSVKPKQKVVEIANQQKQQQKKYKGLDDKGNPIFE